MSHGPVRLRDTPGSRSSSEDHPLATHNLARRGYHSFTCMRVAFHVPTRYTFVRELGYGAYGCVALVHDSVMDKQIAYVLGVATVG